MMQTSKVTTVEDLINDPNFNSNEWEGYIYMTSILPENRAYIGKKNFRHITNVKLGKKESLALPVNRGRKPSKKKVVKESNWKTYYGSSKEVQRLVELYPPDQIIRTVMRLCKTKKELTYYETKYQFQYGVLEDPTRWINDNIAARYFRKDIL